MLAMRRRIHIIASYSSAKGDPLFNSSARRSTKLLLLLKKKNIYVHFFNNSTNLVDRLAALKLSDVREPLLVRLDHVLYDPFRRAIFLFFVFYF